jgi:hypothetical protein
MPRKACCAHSPTQRRLKRILSVATPCGCPLHKPFARNASGVSVVVPHVFSVTPQRREIGEIDSVEASGKSELFPA